MQALRHLQHVLARSPAPAVEALARLLGSRRHAEEALRDEATARAVLSRRGLFAAGLALTSGLVLVGGPLPLHVYTDDSEWFVANNLTDAYEQRDALYGIQPPLARDSYPLEELPAHSSMGIWTDPEGRITGMFEDDATVVSRTMLDWCRLNGRGFLCTTEA